MVDHGDLKQVLFIERKGEVFAHAVFENMNMGETIFGEHAESDDETVLFRQFCKGGMRTERRLVYMMLTNPFFRTMASGTQGWVG